MNTPGSIINHICPKCSAPMEPGLMTDMHTHGAERVQQWVRGTPDKSFWTSQFKTTDRDRLNIVTVRCTSCGFLEHYEPNESHEPASP